MLLMICYGILIIPMIIINISCKYFYLPYHYNLLALQWSYQKVETNESLEDYSIIGLNPGCFYFLFLHSCCSGEKYLVTSEGYLPETESLPLLGLTLSDTGEDYEYAYHTVGPLECFQGIYVNS